jgi:hypothetical protein
VQRREVHQRISSTAREAIESVVQHVKL